MNIHTKFNIKLVSSILFKTIHLVLMCRGEMKYLFFYFLTFFFQISSQDDTHSIKETTFEILPSNYQPSFSSADYYSFMETSMLKCSSFCSQDKNCKSFKYDPKRKLCYFLSNPQANECTFNDKEIFARSVCI